MAVWRLLWLGLWLLLAIPAHAVPACDRVELLEQAERTVMQDGRVIDRQMVGRLDALPRAWRDERVQVRYRVALDPCPGRPDRALWIYRIGAPYRAWIDGRPAIPVDPAARISEGESLVFNGRVPALYTLPAQARTLDIELATVPYVGSGFVRLLAGPHTALLDTRVIDRSALTSMNDVTSTLVGIIGLLALLVWLMRQRDHMVFWFGGACVAWSLRGWAYQTFVYAGPPLLMEQLNPLLVLTTVACLSASTLHAIGQVTRRRLRWMALGYLLTLLGLAAALLLGRGSVPMRSIAFLAAFLMINYGLVLTARQWWRERRRSHALLAGGLFVLIVGSMHDLGMVTGFVTPDHWSFLTPGFTVLLLCHTVAVSVYLGQSLNRAELANEELERRIDAKSRELEHSYALLRESERASARAQERARFNREIHDGLGAQLITALRGVERGALNKDQVAQTLQEGLDELRLLMDSSDLGRSLYDALAAWRNRWDVRLQALGMHLRWSVDDELDSLDLGTDAILQVMRVLQEAVANAVKHAQAHHVTVLAWLEPSSDDPGSESLVLEILDDGLGMPATDPAAAGTGRGLRHMAQRAARIGAQLQVTGAPGSGVRVRLELPLREGGAPLSHPTPLQPV